MIEILRTVNMSMFRTRIGSVDENGILVSQTQSRTSGGPAHANRVYLTAFELDKIIDQYVIHVDKKIQAQE